MLAAAVMAAEGRLDRARAWVPSTAAGRNPNSCEWSKSERCHRGQNPQPRRRRPALRIDSSDKAAANDLPTAVAGALTAADDYVPNCSYCVISFISSACM
ncbi:MAG: hypothetical protein ACK4SY_09300 [Pyrobaculum sp.]